MGLEELDGIITLPEVKGRFQPIYSTQQIVDTETGIEYDGLVDIELLQLINNEIMELRGDNTQYKIIFQDLGLSKSVEEIQDIRKKILKKGGLKR